MDANLLTICVDLTKEFGSSSFGKTIVVAGTPSRSPGLPPVRIIFDADAEEPVELTDQMWEEERREFHEGLS